MILAKSANLLALGSISSGSNKFKGLNCLPGNRGGLLGLMLNSFSISCDLKLKLSVSEDYKLLGSGS